MKKNVDSFKKISTLIKKLSGIDLQPGKESLLDARLYRRLDDLGIDSLDEYFELLVSSNEEQKHCIELITTHKTEWFREMVHFIWLKEQVLKARKFPLTFWSAACSSGEEVYSIMFMLLKLGIPYDKFRILGTDISDKILMQANELPNTDSFQNQLNMLKMRSPNPHAIEENVFAAIDNSIKFRRHNLIHDKFDSSIKFDYAFLRNVLIYFDEAAIVKVCSKISKTLHANGFFIISVTENLPTMAKEFVSIGNSIYRHSNSDRPSNDSGRLKHPPDFSKSIRNNDSLQNRPSDINALKTRNRVLIVEDSVPIQKVLKEVYSKLPNTEVIGTVPTIDAALKATRSLNPNIISLDMKLEDGSGIEFLKQIDFQSYAKAQNARCFLVTDCSQKEGDLVLEALTLGVNWYIQKPQLYKMKEFAEEIEELIHGFFTDHEAGANREPSYPSTKNSLKMSQIELVAIGSSTGGTEIVKDLISGFDLDFPPIVVVQHMPVEFTGLFSKRIANFSGKSVIEISESVPLERGKAYIARGGTHAEIYIQNNSLMARPNNSKPEVNRFKPSVSVLFESIKNAGLASKSIAVMLTGMGFDGADEMKGLKDSGSFTIGQSKETCIVYGMPRAASEKGALCCALSPSQIIALLNGE